MGSLNVLIGPNGSGKSNFLEAISLFQAAPRGIGEPISRMGGIREWLWKGPDAPDSITLEALVDFPLKGLLRHSLTLTNQGGVLVVADEQVEPTEVHSDERDGRSYYRPPKDKQAALEMANANAEAMSKSKNVSVGEWSAPLMVARYRPGAIEFASEFEPGQSLLSHSALPDYRALWHLREQYAHIRLYRNWSFGPGANLRLPCNAHARSDFLDEGAENLPLVLSQLHGAHKKKLLSALEKLFDGIVDVNCPVTGGTVALFLETVYIER